MWDIADLSIELDEEATEWRLVAVQIGTPLGILHIMASVSVQGRALVLSGLHMHGVSANDIGLANLHCLAQFDMQEFGYDELVIQGAVRTSGANPGRTPDLLRFARKA